MPNLISVKISVEDYAYFTKKAGERQMKIGRQVPIWAMIEEAVTCHKKAEGELK